MTSIGNERVSAAPRLSLSAASARTAWIDFGLVPALTMSVAWGLRGFIGGGSLGAMIPGALVALALARALGPAGENCGRFAAFGAIGIGFGGQETYGQTVGLLANSATLYWHSVLGLGVKGATWGWLGGAVLGLGAVAAAIPRRLTLIGLGLMVAGTWLGWRFIDEPKLLYFSNRLDRPRGEVWAGLLTGGGVLLIWIHAVARPVASTLWRLAFFGAMGGGLGFALGGMINAAGLSLGWSVNWYPGWKIMEFTFGLLLGAGLGWAAFVERAAIRQWLEATPSRLPFEQKPGWDFLSAGVGAAVILGCTQLPIRFSYTIAGVMLLALALFSERAAWQLALTVTTGAFLLYVGKFFAANHPGTHPGFATSVALAATLVFSASVSRRLTSGQEVVTWCFHALLWTAVAAGMAHGIWHVTIPPSLTIVLVMFLGLAVWIAYLIRPQRS